MKCFITLVATAARATVITGLVLVVAATAGCQRAPRKHVPQKTDWSQVGLKDPAMEARWGIRVLDIRTSAAGYMVDFRYRVLDAEKAKPLLDAKVIPYLLHESSGAQLMVPTTPLTGPLRQNGRDTKAQRNYFILFANPNQMVKPDDTVTVVIGDFRAEHLKVK